MSESFTSMSRSSVISASTAEHEVKRNLKLVREMSEVHQHQQEVKYQQAK